MNFYLDFEATQCSERIISIGCIADNGAKFRTLVKPVKNEKVNKFIEELTGITNEMLETAPTADEAFNAFYEFVRNNNDFIDSENGRWPSTHGADLISNYFGMKWVPILDTDYHMPDNMEEFKQYADGKSAVNPKVKREGVVIRNPKDDFSFKNVSREYLLKHGG